MAAVEKKMPRAVKRKRRVVTEDGIDAGMEEYLVRCWRLHHLPVLPLHCGGSDGSLLLCYALFHRKTPLCGTDVYCQSCV